MGYSHMFYGLDLDRLRSIHGSGDEEFVAEFLRKRAEGSEDNDHSFEDEMEEEDESEDGAGPSVETAIREIVAGAYGQYEHAESEYGYLLEAICEHLGEPIGGDVYAVRDHSYKSKLVASGPPIPIPYDKADFPEIGYLALADIPDEIKRIDAAPKRAGRTPVRLAILRFIVRRLTGWDICRPMDVEEAVEDMDAYRETLKEAIEKGLSVVSFRY